MIGSLTPPNNLLDDLYSVATDFDKWPVFLKNLSKWLRADGAHILHYDFVKCQFSFSVFHGFDHLTDAQKKKFEVYIGEDPRLVFARNHPEKPFSCRLVLSEEELHDSPVYREILTNVEYTLGVALPNDPSETSDLG